MQSFTSLPSGLPIPLDDGACCHLNGLTLPDISLISTSGTAVNLAESKGWVVIYCYPRTGQPNQALPEGWDEIPGARGCTPQSCAFRDDYHSFQALGVHVYGLSTQNSEYQQEVAQRLHLPFPLLSDSEYQLTESLTLPTFEVAGMRLIKRLTIIAFNGVIQHYFYPVFPPDKNAADVISWLKAHV